MKNKILIRLLHLHVFILMLCLTACEKEQDRQVMETPNSEYVSFPAPAYHPEWFKNSFMDIEVDVEEAKEAGKRLIVYFYQDGCPYCKKLIEHNFGQADVVAFARQHFEIIAVNIFGSVEITDIDGETLEEKDFAKKLNVNFTPTMLTYNEEGEVIFRMNGYYAQDKFTAMLHYLAQKQEAKLKFLDFLKDHQNQNKTPLLDASLIDKTFNVAPVNLEKLIQTQKPTAVFFEEAHCKTCVELHTDILRRKETVEFLDHFNLVVVDVNSEEEIITPSGEKLTSKDWTQSREVQFIPTILFFDKQGSEVFRVDGYVKAFHLQSAFDYVLSESYTTYTGFQPFLHDRADKLEEEGVSVGVMK